MKTIETRISHLERAMPIDGGIDTIIIKAIAPGRLDAEIQRLHPQDQGQQWTRLPDETESQFQDRAMRELDRKGQSVVMLFADCLAPTGTTH